MTGSIDYLAKDGRAYITINRPEKKNAMTNAMLDQLMEGYDLAEADDDVRVVVLQGAGEDFTTGHDLAEVGNEYGETTYDDKGRPRKPSQRARLLHDKRYLERFERVFKSLKPTLSLVKGYCLGGGLYLAEASDLVIAADTAKMGHPEQKLGLSALLALSARCLSKRPRTSPCNIQPRMEDENAPRGSPRSGQSGEGADEVRRCGARHDRAAGALRRRGAHRQIDRA